MTRAPFAQRTPIAGFTLMEVLAALAILGSAMFILLAAHSQSLQLHQVVDEEVNMRLLLERSVAFAEVEVINGALAGGGDFGARYPGFEWSYEATADEDELIPLYAVDVRLTGPTDTREVTFLCFNTGPEDLDGGTGRGNSGKSRSFSRSGASSNGNSRPGGFGNTRSRMRGGAR